MENVIRIAESLVKMNGWTVTRLDVHRCEMDGLEPWYAATLDTAEAKRIVIREDGSFNFIEG